MSVDRPLLDFRHPAQAGDDLDGLLRTFFRREMPEPWPEWQPPEAAPRAVLPRGGLFRSRLALAASIALLTTALWFLAGKPADHTLEPGNGRDLGVNPGIDAIELKESILQERDQPSKYVIEVYERK